MLNSIMNFLIGKPPKRIKRKLRCYCRHNCGHIRHCKSIETTKNGGVRRDINSMHPRPIDGAHPVLRNSEDEN